MSGSGRPSGLPEPWDQTRLRTMRDQTTPTRNVVTTNASSFYPFVNCPPDGNTDDHDERSVFPPMTADDRYEKLGSAT